MTATEAPGPPSLRWHGERSLRVGEVDFRLLGDEDAGIEQAIGVFKTPELVREYIDLAGDLCDGRVVELGIYQGGSTALLHQLYRPSVLLAVELDPGPPPQLARYLEEHDPTGDVRCHFGVDQADRATLRRLVADEVDGPLDVVIDDASHLLAPTMTSFEVLFPLVRPGGRYVIEDWSSRVRVPPGQHRAVSQHAERAHEAEVDAAYEQAMVEDESVLVRIHDAAPERFRARVADDPRLRARLESAWPERMAAILDDADADALDVAMRARPLASTKDLTPIVAHLVAAAVSSPEVVTDVRVRQGYAVIRKGDRPLDPDRFDLLSLADSGLRWPTA